MVLARVTSLEVLLLGGSPLPSVVSASGSGRMGIGWEMAGRGEEVTVLGVERPPVRRMEPSLAASPERCFFVVNLNVVNVMHTCMRVFVYFCVFLCVSK